MPEKAQPRLDSVQAWIVVVAAFVGAFVVYGVTYCFGVFLKPMALEFHASHATMSALFSTITAISFFGAPFTGKLADRFGPRPVVILGALLMGSGLLLAARVHSFPLLFVTYGIGLGGAVACTYIPAVSAVGEWFKKHRDFALALAISGIGCGTLVAAPLSALLTERHGWRATFTMFGWGGSSLLLICALLLARPPVDGKKKRGDTFSNVRTRTFALQYFCRLFAGIAIFVSFVYLPAYAGDIGIGRVSAAGLIGYIGAASVVGRLGLDMLAPRFGLITMYQVAYVTLLMGCAIWLTADSLAALVVFTLLMGIGYGGIAAMSPAVAAATFGVDGLGELLGILSTGFGVACLIGPPIAGVLVDHLHNYKLPVFVAAGAAMVGLLFALPLRITRESKTQSLGIEESR